MRYDKKLPPVRRLLSLAKDVHFPATCAKLVETATTWGFSDKMIDFLKLFPADEIFESRADFMTRCEKIEMFITQALEMPKEILRSP